MSTSVAMEATTVSHQTTFVQTQLVKVITIPMTSPSPMFTHRWQQYDVYHHQLIHPQWGPPTSFFIFLQAASVATLAQSQGNVVMGAVGQFKGSFTYCLNSAQNYVCRQSIESLTHRNRLSSTFYLIIGYCFEDICLVDIPSDILYTEKKIQISCGRVLNAFS